jgi:FAD:protein FMN transferase
MSWSLSSLSPPPAPPETVTSAAPPIGRGRFTRRRAQPWLGTLVAIEGTGDDAQRLDAAVAEAFAAIAEVHHAMSAHDTASSLSALNRGPLHEPVELQPLLARVLRAALALAAASDGAFDPAIGGRLVARGQLPWPADTAPPDPDATFRDVEWRRSRRAAAIVLRRRVAFDLGGIAKGAAVDRAIDVLRRAGLRSAMVNAGGDLRTFGEMRAIAVRDPSDAGRTIPLLEISNAAVATSADTFRAVDDAIPALLDPRSGLPLAAGRSVTVCARRAIWADGLTKVVLADAERARPLLGRLGASAVVLDADGSRRHIGGRGAVDAT